MSLYAQEEPINVYGNIDTFLSLLQENILFLGAVNLLKKGLGSWQYADIHPRTPRLPGISFVN